MSWTIENQFWAHFENDQKQLETQLDELDENHETHADEQAHDAAQIRDQVVEREAGRLDDVRVLDVLEGEKHFGDAGAKRLVRDVGRVEVLLKKARIRVDQVVVLRVGRVLEVRHGQVVALFRALVGAPVETGGEERSRQQLDLLERGAVRAHGHVGVGFGQVEQLTAPLLSHEHLLTHEIAVDGRVLNAHAFHSLRHGRVDQVD